MSGGRAVTRRSSKETAGPERLSSSRTSRTAFGRAIAKERSNGAIGDSLVISEQAVDKHVANIFSKLGLTPSDTDKRRVLAVLRYCGS